MIRLVQKVTFLPPPPPLFFLRFVSGARSRFHSKPWLSHPFIYFRLFPSLAVEMSSPALVYSTVRNVIGVSEAKTVKMPTGRIKWLPSQRALLCEIVVINLMGALNSGGRLMCGMC